MKDNKVKEEVMAVMQPCLDRLEKGEYKTKEDAIDALIADLEAAKEEKGMGGLGGNDKMELPEEEASEEEEEA